MASPRVKKLRKLKRMKRLGLLGATDPETVPEPENEVEEELAPVEAKVVTKKTTTKKKKSLWSKK